VADFCRERASLLSAAARIGEDEAVKKALIILGIAFLVYFVLTQPEGLADVLGSIGDGIADFFEAVITFFTELF
jgi:preprotein translocase subunit SecG